MRGGRRDFEDRGKDEGNFEQFYRNDQHFIQHVILQEGPRFVFTVVCY